MQLRARDAPTRAAVIREGVAGESKGIPLAVEPQIGELGHGMARGGGLVGPVLPIESPCGIQKCVVGCLPGFCVSGPACGGQKLQGPSSGFAPSGSDRADRHTWPSIPSESALRTCTRVRLSRSCRGQQHDRPETLDRRDRVGRRLAIQACNRTDATLAYEDDQRSAPLRAELHRDLRAAQCSTGVGAEPRVAGSAALTAAKQAAGGRQGDSD